MKYLIQSALALLILGACSHMGTSVSTSDVETTPGNFKLRDYQVQNLDNGLKIIWIKDDRLPVVSLVAAIRSGGSFDPKGKEGLAAMTTTLLDKGLPGKNAIQIAETLEQRADTFFASVDADATYVGTRGLSFHENDSLRDFFDIVMHPTFPAAEMERERKNTLAGLERLRDRPSEFATLIYSKFIFGDHPYAHDGTGSPASVKNIKREDVVNFHKRFYSPDRTTLVVVGKYDEAFQKNVVATFSTWKKSGETLIPIPSPKEVPGFAILEVTKPEMQQTEIRMGHIGVKRNIPDHIALKVANTIFGESSFSSRLWDEIRQKRGLTYSVGSHFDQRTEPGEFEISTFTRNDKVYEMVERLLATLHDFREKGVTSAEVEGAKAMLKTRFPHLLETGDDLARQLLILDLNGVPFEYLNTFQDEIDKVTTAQVNDAIVKHYHPENLKILVFGPEGSKGMESLKDFGPVKVENYKEAL
jgi:zinc protease